MSAPTPSSTRRERARLGAALERLQGAIRTTRRVYRFDPMADAWWVAAAKAALALNVELKPEQRGMLRATESQEASMRALQRLCARQGLLLQRIRLVPGWWRQVSNPLIGQTQAGQPVAIIPGRTGTAVIHAGEETRPLNEASAGELAQTAWVVDPRLPEAPLDWSQLMALTRQHLKADVPWLLLTGLSAALIGMATPIFAKLLINTGLIQGDRLMIMQLGLALLIAIGFSTAFQLIAELTGLRARSRVSAWIKIGLADRLLNLPLSVSLLQSPSSWQLRISAIEQYVSTLVSLSAIACISGAVLVAQTLVLFLYSWPAALLVCTLLISLLAAAWFIGQAAARAFLHGEKLDVNVFSLAAEMLQHLPVLRAGAARGRAFNRWLAGLTELRLRTLRSRAIANHFQSVQHAHQAVSLAMVLVVIWIAQAHAMDVGTFIAFVTAFSTASAVTLQLSDCLMKFCQLSPIKQIGELPLKSAPEKRQGGIMPALNYLEFTRVSLRYPGQATWALDSLSLRINRGDMLVLVGTSGSGKSSVLKALLGLYTPSAGVIRVDGNDLSRLDLPAYRACIGSVTQDSTLFRGSVLDNLRAFSNPDIAAIWDILQQVGLADEIKRWPMGLHTLVGDQGAGLSGGQQQRLLIARALLGQPKMLLLDEITSALDTTAQQHIMAIINALPLTRVVISHRLETIVGAKKILVIDKGRGVQTGSFDELKARPGIFQNLCKAQGLLPSEGGQ
jgi:ATP-binding cassette subfamily C protein